MKPKFERCHRECHHCPHLTSLRPRESDEPIPYDPEGGVTVDLVAFVPVVCPGAGSDAMDVPHVYTRLEGETGRVCWDCGKPRGVCVGSNPWVVEFHLFGARGTDEVDSLSDALAFATSDQHATRAIVSPSGRRIEGADLDVARFAYETGKNDWKRYEEG